MKKNKAKKKTVKTKKPVKAKRAIKKTAAKIEPLKMVNVKLSVKDRKALAKRAKQYAQGNISAWLREAGLKHVPKAGLKVPLVYSAKRNSL